MNQAMREKILGADDLKRFPFPAPEWDLPEGLFIRVMDQAESDEFEAMVNRLPDKSGIKGVRVRLALAVLCDADGKQIMRDDDLKALSRKSRVVLDRIFDIAGTVNCWEKADKETLAGNSPAGPSATL